MENDIGGFCTVATRFIVFRTCIVSIFVFTANVSLVPGSAITITCTSTVRAVKVGRGFVSGLCLLTFFGLLKSIKSDNVRFLILTLKLRFVMS